MSIGVAARMSNHNFDKLSAKRARFSGVHFGTFDVVLKHHLHFLTLGILARIAPQRMLHDPNESTGHGKVSHETFPAFVFQLYRHSIMITPISIGPVLLRYAHIIKSTGLVKLGWATDDRRDANLRFMKIMIYY